MLGLTVYTMGVLESSMGRCVFWILPGSGNSRAPIIRIPSKKRPPIYRNSHGARCWVQNNTTKQHFSGVPPSRALWSQLGVSRGAALVCWPRRFSVSLRGMCEVYELAIYLSLVSVSMSSVGSDMSVDKVVATDMHHVSYEIMAILGRYGSVRLLILEASTSSS